MRNIAQGEADTSPLVVCIGDSITQGRVSSNYVDLLRQRMNKDSVHFINAGVGSDLAYNVLRRLKKVIAYKPDFVTIQAGSNDILHTLYSKGGEIYYRLTKKIHHRPSPEWYHDNMLAIVRLLKEKTSAKIALVSIPVLGEDLDSTPNERVRAYNSLLKEIATQEQVKYLPVYERQEDYLRTSQVGAGYPFKPNYSPLLMLLMRKYLLRQSFDKISQLNGFVLTIEGLHMNSRGAAIIADEIESFLQKSLATK